VDIFRGSLASEFSCFCLHAAGRSPPFAMHLDRARSFCVYSSLYAAGRFPPFAVRLDRAQLMCLCFCLDAAGRCSYSPFMLGRCFWYFASPSGHLSAPVVAQRSRRHYVPASDVAALLISLFAQAAKACSLMANEFAQSSAPFCSLGGLLPRGARFRLSTRRRYAQFGLLVLSDSCSSYGYFYETRGLPVQSQRTTS